MKTPTRNILSLSDEDINYALTHWNSLWFGYNLSDQKVIVVHNTLETVKKLMDDKDEDLHLKSSQLEKMRQVVNDDDGGGIKTGINTPGGESEIIQIKKEIADLEASYLTKKRQKLTSYENTLEEQVMITTYLVALYKNLGRSGVSYGKNPQNLEIFESLSDEDINYSISHWNEFWIPGQLKRPEVVKLINALFSVLTDVKKMMDKKQEDIHNKEAQLVEVGK